MEGNQSVLTRQTLQALMTARCRFPRCSSLKYLFAHRAGVLRVIWIPVEWIYFKRNFGVIMQAKSQFDTVNKIHSNNPAAVFSFCTRLN